MAQVRTKKGRRVMRHIRVRQKVSGAANRPRLSVYRSLNHIYAQVIDDDKGVTLAAASSLEKAVNNQRADNPKTHIAALVGELIGKRAQEKGVAGVVFDRGGYRYHGRVKALADAARKQGLEF